MRSILDGNFYELPSVRAFLDQIAEDLLCGRSTLVVLPAGIPAERVRSQVSKRLWDADGHCDQLDLDGYHVKATPSSIIGEVLGLRWPSPDTPRTTSNLISAMLNDKDRSGALLLEGFDSLSPIARRDWIQLLMDWERVSRALEEKGRFTSLSVVASADTLSGMMPSSDVHLGIHEWSGFPSALETRLLCRMYQNDANHRAESRWREHVLPSLAGNDLAVVSELWDDVCTNLGCIREPLLRIAEARNWDQRDLRDRVAKLNSTRSGRANGNNEAWKELWAAGLASRTPEYGWELHPATLAVLGKEEDLAHRIWRGQASLVLPFIERARLALCDDLTSKYGPKWPLLWDKPQNPQEESALMESPRACEWGYLLHLLQHVPRLGSTHQQWLRVVRRARNARNTIAHYQPITFDEFKELWREIGKIPSPALIAGTIA